MPAKKKAPKEPTAKVGGFHSVANSGEVAPEPEKPAPPPRALPENVADALFHMQPEINMAVMEAESDITRYWFNSISAGIEALRAAYTQLHQWDRTLVRDEETGQLVKAEG